jgi:hypothetical protein
MPRKAPKPPSKSDELTAKADARLREQGIEIEPDEYSLDWYRADWPARKRTFIEREIKIRNAFNRNKLEPFILNDAQVELLEASNEAYHDPSLQDVTLKCRRLGISTFYASDYLSDAVIESGHHVRLVAHDPDTLRSLMNVTKTMYEHLRPEIKPQSKYNSIYDLEFNDEAKGTVASRVSISAVVPGQEEKGRGETFTRLHETEIPFWKGDGARAKLALEEAARGGKISEESTPRGVGDDFHKDYQKGKRREGGFRSHFFAWWWNRNYQIAGYRFEHHSGEWYLLKQADEFGSLDDEGRDKLRVSAYTKEEREKLSLPLQSETDCAGAILAHLKIKGYVAADAEWHCDDVAAFIAWRRKEVEKKGARKFRVEYPENDVDCFAATGGSIFADCPNTTSATVRAPQPGHQYVVFLDPSEGVDGGDPYSLKVLDILPTHIEEVYYEGNIKKQDYQGQRCCDLSDQYNGAEIGIERNKGEASILEVERLGRGHRLYRQIDPDLQRRIDDGELSYQEALERAKAGLYINDRMKRLIINELEIDWRRGEYRPASQGFVDESRVFVQDGEKMGAKSGYHDDEVMCAAGGNYIAKRSRGGSPDFAATGEKLASAQMGAY